MSMMVYKIGYNFASFTDNLLKFGVVVYETCSHHILKKKTNRSEKLSLFCIKLSTLLFSRFDQKGYNSYRLI